MSDSQSPSASVQLSESDDLGVIQESVLHDSSSGVGSVQTGFLLRNLDLLVTSISQKYNVERLQVGLGLLLLFLFTFFCLCIAIAWKYYSPVISNYTVKEQEERKRLKMDAFKNFLSKKKVDKHFKRSGPGQRLDSGSAAAPSITAGAAQGGGIDRVAASDIAAQAALKRLYKAEPQISSSQKKIQMIAQRELEEERRRRVQEADLSALTVEEKRGPETKEFEHADVIKGVHFTCELLGEDEVMTKPDLMEALEDFLKTQLSCQNEDAVIPAVLLIYSLNKKPVREAAVETIGKYLQNIIENPEEPKYRRIRISNKVLCGNLKNFVIETFAEIVRSAFFRGLGTERVACVKGAREFLSAVGFEEKMEPAKEGAAPESFLVVSERTVNDVGRIVDALSMLREGQSVPIKVSRDTTIYRIGENERITMPRLPPDFYDLTAEELKKEQRIKTEE
ncbi:unnamed protein product, partial [Nippostrongylus brasiliensis]|uniref:PUB domain-containing protein n=1 Tax=Nippostrongylus brasiliensis TaxID=27835 RepID=A0A0N4XFK6_NIPBR